MRRNIIPPILLIADRFTDLQVRDRLMRAVLAGIRWVQLRDHAAAEQTFTDCARDLVGRIRDTAPDVLVSINARLDVAQKLGTAFHTGRQGPAVREARKWLGEAVIGYSTHSVAEAEEAALQGADYLIFSPVFATRSKPGAVPAGLERLEAACAKVTPVPVMALGGVTPENARRCIEAGATGIAVLSGILAADDVEAAVAAYRSATGPLEGPIRHPQSEPKIDERCPHDCR